MWAVAGRWCITWAARPQARRFAEANVRAYMAEKDAGLDAIIINTSGCGTTVKDYGHLLGSADAATVAAMTMDISEVLARLDLPQGAPKGLRVAYHAACSLQHGQKIVSAPKDLLRRAGFEVVEPRDSHLCCGSAGTYNLMQPEISAQLRDRKVATLEEKRPDVISAGNHRLPDADRAGDGGAGGPYGRAAGLGDGRAGSAQFATNPRRKSALVRG